VKLSKGGGNLADGGGTFRVGPRINKEVNEVHLLVGGEKQSRE